jgi:hypothetical protein
MLGKIVRSPTVRCQFRCQFSYRIKQSPLKIAQAAAGRAGRCLLRAVESGQRGGREQLPRDIVGPSDQISSPPASMPSPRRRHAPKPDRRRALELLAASPDGCTEAIMLAHGFTVELMVELCMAELAIATPECMVAGRRTVEVARMRITKAGRQALTQR